MDIKNIPKPFFDKNRKGGGQIQDDGIRHFEISLTAMPYISVAISRIFARNFAHMDSKLCPGNESVVKIYFRRNPRWREKGGAFPHLHVCFIYKWTADDKTG